MGEIERVFRPCVGGMSPILKWSIGRGENALGGGWLNDRGAAIVKGACADFISHEIFAENGVNGWILW